jgi:Putative Se/S carrier protein-like
MRCVFLFESVHRVMKAEKLLKAKGIKIDVIPVPREISSDCGVAIELSGELEAEALLVLKENRISVVECYTRDLKGRFEKKKEIQIY